MCQQQDSERKGPLWKVYETLSSSASQSRSAGWRFEELLAKVTKPGRETPGAVERATLAGLQEVGRRWRRAVEAAKDQASEVADARGQKLRLRMRSRSLSAPVHKFVSH